MKSLGEIQDLLISELCENLDNLKLDIELDYYNELMGDTSFLIAGYLQHQLRSNFQDWDKEKWIDDSLLTKIKLEKIRLSIWGVVIWGIENQTEQWTEPFYFDIILNEYLTDFRKSTLLFGDLNCPEIIYERFNQNRGVWDKEYYSSNSWSPFEREWKYIITSRNEIVSQES